ncbi:MAG: winged helix-turn-helix domain-containing protein, partial [Steroidobacteraceae bacterium]
MRYRFADLTLDVGRRRVTRNGEALHLGKLTYEMLVALVEAAPNVVTQDQLADRVWSGRFATPETVAQRVKLLRSALDDDTSHPRYIEVQRGQGYRLIPPVESESKAVSQPELRPSTDAESAPSVPQPPRRSRRWWTAVALLVAAIAGVSVWLARDREGSTPPAASQPSTRAAVRSIAVLPFTDMSEGQDQQYFADGIAEEILNRLVKASNLRVISRTSSFSFRDRNADVPQIAAKLDVTHVLEGSIRRAGDRLRITAQLISASTNAHVWSDTYDRKIGDILAVQDDIATEVAAALDASLSTKGAIKPASAKAYENYLHARHFYSRRAPGDLELMAKYLEEAVAIDPGFAAAWAELAGAYHLLVFEHPESESTWHAKRGRAALRAVELDPELAVARLRLAQHYWRAGDRERGREQYQKAVELDPDDLLLLSMNAGTALSRGDIARAVELQRRVVARDPLSATQRNNLASYLTAAGRYEEALAEYRVRDELDLDKKPGDDTDILRLLVLLERHDEAWAIASAMPEGPHRDFGLALLYPAQGQSAQADAALRRLEARQPAHDFLLAEVYAKRGMNDEAVE